MFVLNWIGINLLPFAISKFLFSIFADPPEVEAESAVVHASVGWSLNISCIVWSNPSATVSWYRGQTNMELLQTQAQPQQMVSFRDIFVIVTKMSLVFVLVS